MGKIDSGSIPLKCPAVSCRTHILEKDVKVLVDGHMLSKFHNLSIQAFAEANPSEYSCCQTPGCPCKSIFSVIDIVFADIFFFHPGEHNFNCPLCKKHYCLNCKVEWHNQSTCEQYQKWKRENSQVDQLFEKFVAGGKYKQCPRCTVWVSKRDGCNHMT